MTENPISQASVSFQLPAGGRPIFFTRKDPFPRFAHPSSTERAKAWQPLNGDADRWYQCFIRLLDALAIRQDHGSATDTYQRYRTGLHLCAELDAVRELAEDFARTLKKRNQLCKEEQIELKQLTGRLEPKQPAAKYVQRVRNRVASHVEVPEHASHQAKLTWAEAASFYSGEFDLAHVDGLVKILIHFVERTSTYPVYEWARVLDNGQLQTWVANHGIQAKSRDGKFLLHMISNEAKQRLAARLSIALRETLPAADVLTFDLVSSELFLLKLKGLPGQEACHSMFYNWRQVSQS